MIFHSIEQLGKPFVSVSELGLVIPRHGELLVNNNEVKVLFFIQADCNQEIEAFGTFPVKAGDICVVPRTCRQHYRQAGPGQSERIHVLKISLKLPPLPAPGQTTGKAVAKGNPESDLAAFCQHHFTEIRHLPGAQDARMQEIMLAIRREAEEHRAGIRHRVRALCTNLIVHVARRLHDGPTVAKPAATGHGFVVNQAKEYLRRNYAKTLTLGEIAWHAKLSEEHLARVFRKVTGQTVFDYLRTVRLENAKNLLIDSSQTLTEIATLTGFGSLSLFSRNFSQYVGQSASSYRQARAQRVTW
jgi:AraC-like DNA-binding protein